MLAENNLEATHEIFNVLETSSLIADIMLDRLPMILVATDGDGTIFKVNQATKRFFSSSKKQLLGKKFTDIVGEDAKKFFDKYFHQTVNSHNDDEVVTYLEKEENQFVAWSISSITSNQGYLEQIHIILGSDTTEMINMQTSISAAKIIQNALLPTGSQNPAIEIVSHYQSAEDTGGDLFDYCFNKDVSRFYAIIADVNGHGIPAALMTGSISGAFKGILSEMEGDHSTSQEENLINLAHSINDSFMSTSIRTSLLASMALISIEVKTGSCTYLNAGHQPIFRIHTDGKIDPVLLPGPLLGLNSEPKFTAKTFKLKRGEKIFLHTDGLVENTGPHGEHITNRSLKNLLQSSQDSTIIKENILATTKTTWREHPPNDDVAFLIVHLA